jgi:pyruvate/2-oxoglutarate dehydrogenase complex dihydrolipoamide acyltransferase (E2) component
MRVTVRVRWTPERIRAHAEYLAQNTMKAVNEVPMHGRRRQHIERNLQNLKELATVGACEIHTNDQVLFVRKKLKKSA